MSWDEIMSLSETLRARMDGKRIIGKDGRDYTVNVSPGNPLSVRVTNPEDKYNGGILPSLCCLDYERTIISTQIADFTYFQGLGLYKKVISMISNAVPAGTCYRTAVARTEDQESLIRSVRSANRRRAGLSLESCLDDTLIGHVFSSSKFNNIKVLYKNFGGRVYRGKEALQEFNREYSKNIFTTSHGTELFIVAKKYARKKM
jgi:hypothetical protein